MLQRDLSFEEPFDYASTSKEPMFLAKLMGPSFHVLNYESFHKQGAPKIDPNMLPSFHATLNPKQYGPTDS